MKTKSFRYLFIIDTEQYSGNFEREMCAVLTGTPFEYYHSWDKLRAEETRELYAKMNPSPNKFIEEHILHDPNPESNSDFPSPVCLIPTPGWWNNGRGVETKGKPPEGQESFPAYLSVGLKFNARPPDYLLKLFKKRAEGFSAIYMSEAQFHHPVTVTGCRLVIQVTEFSESEEQII